MVKHIILWKIKDEYTDAQKAAIKADIKAGLEGLVGVVPNLLEVKVHIEGLPTCSNCDLMLDSTVTDTDALAAYAAHPAHVAVAKEKIVPFMAARICYDFEE